MKKIVCLIILAVFTLSINSCKKEKLLNTKETIENFDVLKNSSSSEIEKKEYDKNLRKFAKALAKSLKHKDLRKKIKDEAMLKIDGDYDIIWKNFKNSKVKIENGEINLLEVIAENSDEKDKTKKEKIVDIEKFGNNYKRLQIAVPVNCDKWNTEIFQPIVIFLPTDYDEGQEQISGFDGQGKEVVISNITIPEFPVVVVNMNERSDENGKIHSNYQYFKLVQIEEEELIVEGVLPKPLGFSATASTTGIWLTWTQYAEPGAAGIVIERNSGSGYVSIATVSTVNSDFTDTQNLIFGKTYYYRIKAVSVVDPSRNSAYSTPVSATFTNKPPAPADFTVDNIWANQMSLTWTNPSTNFFNTSIIIKRIVTGVNTSWEQIATLPININYYLDINLQYSIYPLNKYRYMVYYDGGGINNTSDASFDVSYNTQRLVGQPLYLTHIKVDDISAIESWAYGAPEFVYTVGTMNGATNTPVTLASKVTYEPDKRGGSGSVTYNDNIKMLNNWDKDFAMSVMSINFVEYDGEWLSGSFKVTVGVKAATKIKKTGEINIGAGGDLTLQFKNSDKNISTEYVYYWEQTSVIRDYAYGVHVRFSNESNSDVWPGK